MRGSGAEKAPKSNEAPFAGANFLNEGAADCFACTSASSKRSGNNPLNLLFAAGEVATATRGMGCTVPSCPICLLPC